MPLPTVKEEVFAGIIASIGKNTQSEEFLERYIQMVTEQPAIEKLLVALLQDRDESVEDPEALVWVHSAVLLGMVYTYMVLRTQAESDDLREQWS